MVLGVDKHLFPLCAVGIEVRVGSIETCPVVTVDDAVVICRRIVVTETDIALVTPDDIPALGVVAALRPAQIVGHPRGDVVV